jgi:hypothetical protein
MKGYIYKVETNEIIAQIEGGSNADIESQAEEMGYMGMDEFGLSYTDNGLI